MKKTGKTGKKKSRSTKDPMRHIQSGSRKRRLYVEKDGEEEVYVEDEDGEAHARLDSEEGEAIEATDPTMNAMVPTAQPVRAHLLVCIGQNVGHSYPLLQRELLLGRDPRNDIVLDDRKVSASHCKVVAWGQMHRVVDLGSQNGVLVNAARVQSCDLRHGDLVQVGRSVFRYWVGDPVRGEDHSLAPAQQPGHRGPPAPHEEWEVAEVHAEPPQRRRQRPTVDAEFEFRATLDDRYKQVTGRTAPTSPEGDTSVHELLLQLGRIYAFFRPYWLSILIITVLGGAAGAGSYFAKPPLQAAAFAVSLTPKPADNPVHTFERSNVEFFRSAEQNFKAKPLIKRTLEELGQTDPPPAVVAAVQASLEFEMVGPHAPNTYQGRYEAEDADHALAFLSRHVDIYLETEIEKTLKVIRVEADFLQEQMENTEKELRRTEEELLTFKKENIDGLPAQARQYYDYLFELQRKQQEVGKSLDAVKAQLTAGERALLTEKPMVETRVVNTRPFAEAIVDVKRRMAEARAQGKGAEHPDVLALKREQKALEEMAKGDDGSAAHVERSVNPVREEIQDSVHRLRVSAQVSEREAERLKLDYERVKQIVSKLPELEARYADLTRSYDATKNLHTKLFEQLKTTLLQLELERASASARYDIISPPTIDYVSVPRTISRRAAIGLFLGMLCGLLVAAARQVRKDLMLA